MIRKIASIDPEKFWQDIYASPLYAENPTNSHDYLSLLNRTLTDLLDKHAPARSVTLPSRPSKPFITPEIRAAKKIRSRLETIYRKTRNPDDLVKFKKQALEVAKLITKSKRQYYRLIISEQSKNPCKL